MLCNGHFRRLSGPRMVQKHFNFVFSLILESFSRFGYHPVDFFREMFQMAKLRNIFGSGNVGWIGDHDIFLNQSSAAFVFILHLFSFGFHSGESRADVLCRLLFSILKFQVIVSISLADHSDLFFSFYSLLLSLAPPFSLVFSSFVIFLLSRFLAQHCTALCSSA